MRMLKGTLDNHRVNAASRREEFGIDLWAHESGSTGSARNEVDPHGRPSKGSLKRTNSHKTKRGCDGSASVD
jgi:hypothetical protein